MLLRFNLLYFVFCLPLAVFSASFPVQATPDTTKSTAPDSILIANNAPSLKIDSLPDQSEPPSFINKFSKFKRLFDKILTSGGDTLFVLINSSTGPNIDYCFPLNYRKESINKRLVKTLIYSDGTVEDIVPSAIETVEKTAPGKLTEKDWDKIFVFKEIDEASGTEDLGEIASKFEGDRINVSSAYLEKSAMILLKKKAARLGANSIYITNKDEYRSYGELPNMNITARAYYK